MDKTHFIVFLFLILLIISFYYITLTARALKVGKITPSMVDSMDKEELKAYAQASEKIDVNDNVIPITLILIASLGIITGYFISRTEKPDCKNVISFFNKEERKAIEIILESDGKILQNEWRLKMKINKSKASRLADKLEKRGIINIEKIGKINRLYLTNEFKKSINFKK